MIHVRLRERFNASVAQLKAVSGLNFSDRPQCGDEHGFLCSKLDQQEIEILSFATYFQ
jgi:hypothetical protein